MPRTGLTLFRAVLVLLGLSCGCEYGFAQDQNLSGAPCLNEAVTGANADRLVCESVRRIECIGKIEANSGLTMIECLKAQSGDELVKLIVKSNAGSLESLLSKVARDVDRSILLAARDCRLATDSANSYHLVKGFEYPACFQFVDKYCDDLAGRSGGRYNLSCFRRFSEDLAKRYEKVRAINDSETIREHFSAISPCLGKISSDLSLRSVDGGAYIYGPGPSGWCAAVKSECQFIARDREEFNACAILGTTRFEGLTDRECLKYGEYSNPTVQVCQRAYRHSIVNAATTRRYVSVLKERMELALAAERASAVRAADEQRRKAEDAEMERRESEKRTARRRVAESFIADNRATFDRAYASAKSDIDKECHGDANSARALLLQSASEMHINIQGTLVRDGIASIGGYNPAPLSQSQRSALARSPAQLAEEADDRYRVVMRRCTEEKRLELAAKLAEEAKR